MKNIFESTASSWVKYSEYEYRESDNGVLYIMPSEKAKPIIYNPFENIEEMLIDALNVNMLGKKKSDDVLKRNIIKFVSKYGLLGFMTALPTTPKFMDYEAVYFPKNNYIKVETLPTKAYTDLFFPFSKPDYQKDSRTLNWIPDSDIEMKALALTMADLPLALNIALGRDYAERYDWLLQQFKDWAFICVGAILYYEDKDKADETTLHLYRQGMAAFSGIAPTYKVALLDKPMILWEFHSLLLEIQMMFSFMLTDETKPLRICRHCNRVFVATHHNAAFCGAKCKNQYNVYKNRTSKRKQVSDD